MKRNSTGQLLYSPSDLVRYLASPFASWMDRYFLEYPDAVTPDERSAEDRLIAETGQAHERTVLTDLKAAQAGVVELHWPSGIVQKLENVKADQMLSVTEAVP